MASSFVLALGHFRCHDRHNCAANESEGPSSVPGFFDRFRYRRPGSSTQCVFLYHGRDLSQFLGSFRKAKSKETIRSSAYPRPNCPPCCRELGGLARLNQLLLPPYFQSLRGCCRAIPKKRGSWRFRHSIHHARPSVRWSCCLCHASPGIARFSAHRSGSSHARIPRLQERYECREALWHVVWRLALEPAILPPAATGRSA